MNRVVIAHLNINSFGNKFESLIEQTVRSANILMISDTKLDSTFPAGQLLINGYNEPFITVWDSQGGGIMLNVREDIKLKLLETENLQLKVSRRFAKEKMISLLSLHIKHSNLTLGSETVSHT